MTVSARAEAGSHARPLCFNETVTHRPKRFPTKTFRYLSFPTYQLTCPSKQERQPGSWHQGWVPHPAVSVEKGRAMNQGAQHTYRGGCALTEDTPQEADDHMASYKGDLGPAPRAAGMRTEAVKGGLPCRPALFKREAVSHGGFQTHCLREPRCGQVTEYKTLKLLLHHALEENTRATAQR